MRIVAFLLVLALQLELLLATEHDGCSRTTVYQNFSSICAIRKERTCLRSDQTGTSTRNKIAKLKLLVVTTATEDTDAHKRFLRSAKHFNQDVLVVRSKSGGKGTMESGINELKNQLQKYKNSDDTVILFIGSNDAILTDDKDAILWQFSKINARLVFSAGTTAWTDFSADPDEPVKEIFHPRGILGYGKEFLSALDLYDDTNDDRDQLYTKAYLDTTMREKLNATTDHTRVIFQMISHENDEVELHEIYGEKVAVNLQFGTSAAILLATGSGKIRLNYFGNYIPNGWNSKLGCQNCNDDVIEHDYEDEQSLPHVLMALFVRARTPFVGEFFEKIAKLDYPKSRMSLFVLTAGQNEEKVFSKFLVDNGMLFRSVNTIPFYANADEINVRNAAFNHCDLVKCDYFFGIDSTVQITNAMTLKYLISRNRKVIAPLVKKRGKNWSNFWGALNDDGYYKRSEDYLAIISGNQTGIWNVPFVNSIYLMKHSAVKGLSASLGVTFDDKLDFDVAICKHFRKQDIFMFVSNEETFGSLLQEEEELTDVDNVDRLHPDLWEIKRNRAEWEEKYLHPSFWNVIDPETVVDQPCTDVYKFPLVTETYADHLVETVENMNIWSSGKNEDPRIAGGYENVPTIDVHMKQIGYQDEWKRVLKRYVTKVINKVFPGYFTEADTHMMFMVRYRPDEQPFLRPHHDHATWTVNVALNTQMKDYEGGGCRFLRYNCSVTNLPKGWAVVHPGKLTHYHEGLYTTKGTRYIMVSFMDP